MKKRLCVRNFIIYLLFVVFIITGCGVGLDKEYQVFSACKKESSIQPHRFTVADDLHIFEVREQNTLGITLRRTGENRTETFYKNILFALCVVALLARMIRIIQNQYILYDRLYIKDRLYMVTFMHDTDGRKRIL